MVQHRSGAYSERQQFRPLLVLDAQPYNSARASIDPNSGSRLVRAPSEWMQSRPLLVLDGHEYNSARASNGSAERQQVTPLLVLEAPPYNSARASISVRSQRRIAYRDIVPETCRGRKGSGVGSCEKSHEGEKDFELHCDRRIFE